jgi:hypothetical protein
MSDMIAIRGGAFELCECGCCGVVYVVPKIVRDEHRKNGGFSFCPNGHQWGWKEGGTEFDHLRRERDRLIQDAAFKDDEIRRLVMAKDEAEKAGELRAAEVKRLKKRASAGTCPCCKRSFVGLARHMSQKHPEFQAEAGTAVVPFKKSEKGQRA